ncbi:putative leucine-rich repeat-containing protein DDB_G0290503 isoform X2 [Hydra vulgaris]
MERCHSYSGGSWSLQNKEKSLQVATVKPVSKSVSEDNLHSDLDKKIVLQRVFSRLKINDLSVLKKDSLIGELEKCLEELETEHSQTLQLANVYDKMESERDQLLNELDMAFQDLQEYMHRQKLCEDNMRAIEADRDELVKENEYLKAVLSNREEIQANKLYDENKKLNEEITQLVKRVNELTEEMDSLYEERQTLISSLLSLHSEQVESVIRSRTSSFGSSHSKDGHNKIDFFDKYDVDSIMSINEIVEVKKVLTEVLAENKEIKASLHNLKNQLGQCEKEKQDIEAEYSKIKNEHDIKCKEYDKSIQEKNEKNLSLSKVNKEKRTLQMQVSALRERNRSSEAKVLSLEDEIKRISDQLKELNNNSTDLLKKNFDELQIKNQDISSQLFTVMVERDSLLKTIKKMEEDSELVEKKYYNRVNSLEIDFNKLRNSKVRRKEDVSLESKNRQHICECPSMKCKCMFLKSKKSNKNIKPSEISEFCQHCNHESTPSSDFAEVITCNLETVASSEIAKVSSCNFESLLPNENSCRGTIISTQTETLETERLKKENEVLKEKNTEVILEVTTLKDTIQSYCLDIRNGKQKLDSLQETCDALLLEKSAVADSLRKIFQSNGEYISNDSLIHQINVLNELLNQLNVKNQTLSSSCKSLSLQVVDLKEKCDKLSEKSFLKDLSSEIDIRNQAACLIKEKDEALCESNMFSQKCVLLENQIKQLKDENCDLSSECKMLLSKIETLNSDLINLKENNNLLQLKLSSKESEHEEKYFSLHTQHEKLTEHYNCLLEQHNSITLKLDQVVKENWALNKTYNENFNSIQIKNDELMEHCVSSELQIKNLTFEIAELHASNKSREIDYQSQISNHLSQIDNERKSFKTTYDTLRAECDKLKREKEHYLKIVDTLREENCEINLELKKLRVSPTEDFFYQCVQEDKKNMEELQTTIRQLTGEKAGLMDKIKSNEEISSTNIRSLKAHKSELQHRVASLEHENENLRRNQFCEDHVKRIIELEDEKAEYLQKLKESEVLLLDLQKALAQANDVAMQKSLEGTKIRRCFEKKIDKLMHVNAELKRRSFFSESENNSLSSTFLESNKNDNLATRKETIDFSVATRKETKDFSVRRKSSLPPLPLKKKNYLTNVHSQSLSASPSHEESSLSLSNLEQDLAEQLKQLLDITNELECENLSIQNPLISATDVR